MVKQRKDPWMPSDAYRRNQTPTYGEHWPPSLLQRMVDAFKWHRVASQKPTTSARPPQPREVQVHDVRASGSCLDCAKHDSYASYTLPNGVLVVFTGCEIHVVRSRSEIVAFYEREP